MKTFPLKLEKDLHIQIKIAAAQQGLTIGDWIVAALEEKIKKAG